MVSTRSKTFSACSGQAALQHYFVLHLVSIPDYEIPERQPTPLNILVYSLWTAAESNSKAFTAMLIASLTSGIPALFSIIFKSKAQKKRHTNINVPSSQPAFFGCAHFFIGAHESAAHKHLVSQQHTF